MQITQEGRRYPETKGLTPEQALEAEFAGAKDFYASK